jgi:hypothetical protein
MAGAVCAADDAERRPSRPLPACGLSRVALGREVAVKPVCELVAGRAPRPGPRGHREPRPPIVDTQRAPALPWSDLTGLVVADAEAQGVRTDALAAERGPAAGYLARSERRQRDQQGTQFWISPAKTDAWLMGKRARPL